MIYFNKKIYHNEKMNLKEFCEKLDIDYDNVLLKFGNNEILYKHYIKKFLEDETYYELEKSWNVKNYDEVEKSAHTLKGVSANLGINRLFELTSKIVQAVRMETYDNMEETYKKLEEEYRLTKEMINELD